MSFSERISADGILLNGTIVQGLCLEVDPGGVILDISYEHRDVKMYEGILVPGWVNAHTHLELSHLKGLIPRGTGMAGFARAVVELRQNVAEQESSIRQAFQELIDSGTAGVGDIANEAATFEVKAEQASQLWVRTFIELFDLMPDRAAQRVEQGRQLQAACPAPASLTLHAPYSVTSPLIQQVAACEQTAPFSIHVLESQAERQLFSDGSGPFVSFFKSLGLDETLYPSGNPLAAFIQHIPDSRRMLWVHCTEITDEEVQQLEDHFSQNYYVLCPRSNDYIHGRLPDPARFPPDRICLGTDSLASNDDLLVWREVQALQQAYPGFSRLNLLLAATQQGADALELASTCGSFSPGQAPGINLLTFSGYQAMEHLDFTACRPQVLYPAHFFPSIST